MTEKESHKEIEGTFFSNVEEVMQDSMEDKQNYSSSNKETLDLSCLRLRNIDTEILALTYGFKPYNVTKLVLFGNLLNVVPSNIFHFINLEELDVSSNEITWVSGEVAQLSRLRVLQLQNNRLQILPKELEQCTCLKVLNLGGNMLTDFPPQIFNLIKLTELYLGGNQIVCVPPLIARNKSLKMLYLGGNKITSVTPQLKKLKNLKHLVLCDNKLRSIPQDLGQLKSLESLSLHRNQLNALPMSIVLLTNLQELTLRDNPLVDTFIKKLEFNPPSLLEICGRFIKMRNISYNKYEIPKVLCKYLDSAKCCVNPKCDGVYFDSRVKTVKFVDFCGRFRLPFEQYLCSPCEKNDEQLETVDHYRLKKVLLPADVVDSD